LRPSHQEGPGLISGETRPPDRLRPCRSAPAGAYRPPPAPAGALCFPLHPLHPLHLLHPLRSSQPARSLHLWRLQCPPSPRGGRQRGGFGL